MTIFEKQVLTKDFKKCYMTIKDETSPYKSNFLRVLKKLLAFASCTPKWQEKLICSVVERISLQEFTKK